MESQDRDQFDELLDGALKHYGNVEPRARLEGRVLERLIAARKDVGTFWSSAVAFVTVGGACVVFIAGTIVIAHHHSRRTEAAMQRRAAIAVRKSSAETVAPSPKKPEPVARFSAPRHKVTIAATTAVEAVPRLSQFPSSRPLSEQEQWLKQYVRAFPQEATIIAREQTLREQEFEKLLATQYSSGDSD